MLGHAAISEVPISALPEAGSVATKAGGVFHRSLWSLSRTWKRNLDTVSRKWRRPASSLVRVWRFQVSNAMPVDVLPKPEGEDRDYGFDFSKTPEIVAGATISSSEILGGSGLTIGTPAANVAIFDGIAIGKAVVVEISGGSDDNTYSLACRATLSTGRKIVIPGKIAVTSNYE